MVTGQSILVSDRILGQSWSRRMITTRVLYTYGPETAQRSRFSAPRVGRAQQKSPAWSGEKGLVPQGGIEPPTRGFSDLGLEVYSTADVAGIRSGRRFSRSRVSTTLLPYARFHTLLVTPGSFDSNPCCHQTSSVIKDAPLSLRSLTRDHQRGHHTEHDLAKHTGTAASGNGASVQTILARRLEMRQ